MNVNDFYAAYAEKYDLSFIDAKAECRSVLLLLAETIRNLQPDEKISIYGFGSFTKNVIKEHTTIDRKTGERVIIPKIERIYFTKSQSISAPTENYE